MIFSKMIQHNIMVLVLSACVKRVLALVTETSAKLMDCSWFIRMVAPV